MKQQTNSGQYVYYADGRSSACPSGVAFTSAKSDALSVIHRNRTFQVPQKIFLVEEKPPKDRR